MFLSEGGGIYKLSSLKSWNQKVRCGEHLEAEAGDFCESETRVRVLGQSGLHRATLSQKTKQQVEYTLKFQAGPEVTVCDDFYFGV